MAHYVTTDFELTCLANAIRAKGGTSASLVYPSGFVSAINDIPSGGSSELEDALVMRTLSGVYTNSRVSMVGVGAFKEMPITGVDLPNCYLIDRLAFQSCPSLTTISIPNCTAISGYAFYDCSVLKSVECYYCFGISEYAFYGCSRLSTVSFAQCYEVGSYAFRYCYSLTSVAFPGCTTVGSYAFQGCSKMTMISFPHCTTLGLQAFAGCSILLSAYFLGTVIPSITNSQIFMSTPISMLTVSGQKGSIFVRASMYAEWRSTRWWSGYSSRFVGLTDEEIAALGVSS